MKIERYVADSIWPHNDPTIHKEPHKRPIDGA